MQSFLQSIAEADAIYQYLGVFIVSMVPFFESYAAIPLGVILGFPIIPVGLIAIVGNLISVLGFIWIINKVRGGNKEQKEGGTLASSSEFL